MEHKLEIGGKTFIVNLEQLAEQANGSVFVRLGDTLVMATATMSSRDLEGLDFFPLKVEFEEKFYAVGKILGSRFMRREGKPSDESILTARLIDRSIRPLFPKNLKREVQIIISCYSFDGENDPDIPGALAASLALGISDIPWQGPIAPIRVCKLNNGLIVNPSYEERGKSNFDMILSGLKEDKNIIINMVEALANENTKEELMEGIESSEENIKKILDFQEKIIKEYGKEKANIGEMEKIKEIDKEIEKLYAKQLEEALFQKPDIKNRREMSNLQDEIIKTTKDNFGEEKIPYTKEFIENLLRDFLHKRILERKERPDGRKLNEIREIDSRIEVLPRTHGSAIFFRGKTKSLSNVTLGPPSDQKLIEGMEVRGKKRFMHHYNFPPFCSGEIKPLRGPGRREIGHGNLAEKALIPVIPNFEDFPYTIRIVTEILSSNGSTSMASVSSSSLALMDAGVPIKRPVAGIAMGLIKEKENYKILTDIQGPEDHFGDMDFKVAGTEKGITAIQMDVKISGINDRIIEEILALAEEARKKILEKTDRTLNKPKDSLSEFAPKIFRIVINPEKIGSVIGPGGKIINEIIEKCEVSIDIEEDGNVFVASESENAAQKAIEWIKNITREIKVGEVFQGKVTRILDFGAIVEILPERDGLVHISELAPYRVRKVEDMVKIGEIIPVKVLNIDNSGKISLSLKAAKREEPKRKN